LSSLIDSTKPATGAATTASVRDNFAVAASEITALQVATAAMALDIDALELAPPAHAASHQAGGTDEIGTATPAAGAIPKADGSGKLDAWITPSSGGPTSVLWFPVGKYSASQESTNYAGRIRVTSAFLPAAMTVTHLRHRFYSRVDASDVYSLGLYDLTGALVLTTGLIDPSGFAGDSLIDSAVVGSPVTLPAGDYLLAWSCKNGNLKLWTAHSEVMPGFVGADPRHGYPAETTATGALPATITLPLDTVDAYRTNTAWMALIGS
jgi:hypothetical protein